MISPGPASGGPSTLWTVWKGHSRPIHSVHAKAANPDEISRDVDGACGELLAGVLMDIFNLSLGQAAVPKCIKPPPLCHCPKLKPAWLWACGAYTPYRY